MRKHAHTFGRHDLHRFAQYYNDTILKGRIPLTKQVPTKSSKHSLLMQEAIGNPRYDILSDIYYSMNTTNSLYYNDKDLQDNIIIRKVLN